MPRFGIGASGEMVGTGKRAWARWAAACIVAAAASSSALAAKPLEESLRSLGISPQAREAVHRALVGGDAQGRPFAVVDKPQARLLVFAGDGRFLGSTAALLGQATGDYSAPGIGRRLPGQIAPHERTTPAGRYESEPGRNIHGEAIVWFDYESALAIHRLRPAAASERRPQRLASATPDDNRISLGCVVIDPGFFDTVVAPSLGRQRGVVYVLPERDGADRRLPPPAGSYAGR